MLVKAESFLWFASYLLNYDYPINIEYNEQS